MASDVLIMKRHDTRPFLDVTLYNTDGNSADLSASGLTVNFTMKDSDTDVVKVDRQSASIIDGEDGTVRYAWDSADTDTSGTYLGEFEVNYPNGDKMTYPASDILAIVILDDYDNT